jgi:capsular polysaccharide biosynthesis protein
MKRWLRLAVRLYPAAWRARYASEFAALLDDLEPAWRDVYDIFRGAIHMRLSTPATYLKLGAITAALGALVASGVSFTMPQRYVSSAVMRISPAATPSDTSSWQYRILATQRLSMMQQEVLSRHSLAEIIQRPELDLYRGERMRYPLEDVIQDMRDHDVRIKPVDSGPNTAFAVSYESSDPRKAQAVVRALLAKFTKANVETSRRLMSAASSPRGDAPKEVQQFFDVPKSSVTPPAPSSEQARAAVATNLEILDPASLPVRASRPNRLAITAIGLAAGFGLGLLIAFLRRRPLRWTLWMAASAIFGFVAAFIVTIYTDLDPNPFAGFGALAALCIAGYRMRDRAAWQPVPYVKSALAAGAIAAVLAGLGSFAIPARFVSTATVRMFQQGIYGLAAPDTTGAVPERFRVMRQEILSRQSLAELIQRPSLDLYRAERQRRPLEDIIRDMRAKDIHITPASAALEAFTITFEYPDRHKALAVARELVTKFTELNVTLARNAGYADLHQAGAIVVEVIDPPSNPQTPSSPNHWTSAAIGFAAGIPIGLILAFLRRRPPGQAWSIVRFAAATGAAGAVLATAIAFAIPSRYVSTAVLRVLPSDPQSRDEVAAILMEVFNSRTLGDEVRRNVHIESLEAGPGGRTTAFSISYESSDPVKAFTTVQMVVTKFVEPSAHFNDPGVAHSRLEVLDPATLPDAPAFPARLPIALGGLFAGLVLGPAAVLLRLRRAASFNAAG